MYIYTYINTFVYIQSLYVHMYVQLTYYGWWFFVHSHVHVSFIYNFSYCSSLTSAANNKIKVKQHQKYKNKHKQREWEAENRNKEKYKQTIKYKMKQLISTCFLSFVLLFCLVWCALRTQTKNCLYLFFWFSSVLFCLYIFPEWLILVLLITNHLSLFCVSHVCLTSLTSYFIDNKFLDFSFLYYLVWRVYCNINSISRMFALILFFYVWAQSTECWHSFGVQYFVHFNLGIWMFL